MIDRRTFLTGAAGLGALTAMVTLAGCAQSASPAGTVRYWGINGTNVPNENRVLNAFAKTPAGRSIRVEKSSVPQSSSSDATGIITAVRGKTAPDVWYMDRFTAAQFAALGLLEPIDDMIRASGATVDDVRSEYVDFAIDELTYDGKLYGLPTECDSRVLYYNRKTMRAGGLDPDELDPANGPVTVDRILEMSDRLTKKDARGNYTQLGLIPWDGEGYGFTWSLAKGAKFFDGSSCTIDLSGGPVESAYQFLYDEARRLDYKKVDAFTATYTPPNAPPAQTAFNGGQEAFLISGNWIQQSINQYVPDLDFGTTYLPVFDQADKPYTWSGGYALVCPKGSSMSKDVWEFMKFYAGPVGQSIYMPRAYVLPTQKEVLRTTTNPVLTKDLKFFVDQLAFSTSRPPFPVSALWWDSMTTAQQAVELGSSTPRQALAAAQARVTPQMALYCPFTMPAGYRG